MAAETHLFVCRSDNYGVLLHDTMTGATAAIDAPDAACVEDALARTGWRLSEILVTHHHADHTDGIRALKQHWGARVIAPRREAERIPEVNMTVAQGDTVAVGQLTAQVIETPGHTAGHIAYWLPDEKLAFVGDTLFAAGCGRVIEGTMADMWASLLKLRALPDDTKIYCGHEYTESNIRFAQSIEPSNPALAARAAEVARQRAAKSATIPVTIGSEKMLNPFLRADVPSVAAALGLGGAAPEQVFAELRGRKDRF